MSPTRFPVPCFTADVAGRHVGELSTQKLLTALMDSFAWAHQPPHPLKQPDSVRAGQTPASALTHPRRAHALGSLPLALVGQVSLSGASARLLCLTGGLALPASPLQLWAQSCGCCFRPQLCGLCRAPFRPQAVHAAGLVRLPGTLYAFHLTACCSSDSLLLT